MLFCHSGKKGDRGTVTTLAALLTRGKNDVTLARHTSALSSCHACFPETDFALYESRTGVQTRVYRKMKLIIFFPFAPVLYLVVLNAGFIIDSLTPIFHCLSTSVVLFFRVN